MAALADPFETLNPEQRAAVEHGSAPLLVIAGAGSGKTLTLAARVARLVLQGADPQRLLLLTFSRRAAHEMQRRTGRLLHQALGLRATQQAPQLPWAGTFHAIGARLLREHAAQIGLADTFTIADRGDAEDLMGLVRQDLGLAAAKSRFPLKGTCLAIYSRCVNAQAPLAQVLAEHYPWCAGWEAELKRLFRAYVAEKQRQHTLDYDDLLLAWDQMLTDAALAQQLGERFPFVLVDEYQDTNRLQSAILRALKPAGHGLTVVGDDAQSIYSFRAAEVRNILEFAQHFGPTARVLPLERNYRSTQPILDASNAVIALSPERHAKTLWTERAAAQRPQIVSVLDEMAQATWVADNVLAQREAGLKLKQQAVLFRTSHHSAALELELTRRRIPFVKFGGLKFLEAAHIKDVLAVLRWAENPKSRIAGFRVALLVPGIGPANARRLLDAMDAAARPLQALAEFEPPANARADWQALVGLMQALRAPGAGPGPAGGAWPADLEAVQRWYAPHLQRLHEEDAPVRLADLEQLTRLATAQPSRERFLTELTLDPPEATSDESGPPHLDEDYLILSTIHSAKGQEWSAVTVLNVVDGCMPADLATGSAAAIEEERRLLYVAMTRAKQQLALMVPQRFHVTQQPKYGDRHLYGSLTRFIPPPVAALFERVGPAAPPAPAACAPAAAPPRIDIGERLRAAWD
ncbi:MAG: ATP-dependent helicase [Burkholderiales bacterium]|nr:ATP-dependent helicase [Burkholderiales bacterium]